MKDGFDDDSQVSDPLWTAFRVALILFLIASIFGCSTLPQTVEARTTPGGVNYILFVNSGTTPCPTVAACSTLPDAAFKAIWINDSRVALHLEHEEAHQDRMGHDDWRQVLSGQKCAYVTHADTTLRYQVGDLLCAAVVESGVNGRVLSNETHTRKE